jgi:anti-anti-sigma factor
VRSVLDGRAFFWSFGLGHWDLIRGFGFRNSDLQEGETVDYETADLVVREVKGVTIVRLKNANLTGVLEIQHITSELDRLIEKGVRRLVFDFKYVRHAGSSALGLLIALQKKMDAKGGKMVLSHSENIHDLLHVSRTASLFKLANDPKAAFAML